MSRNSVLFRFMLIVVIVILCESGWGLSQTPARRAAPGGGKNKPPSVQITRPASGAVFVAPATVSIEATASDRDGAVSKVEFFSGSTLLNTDTISPYACVWTNVPAGSYSLTARATDNGGAAKTSSAVIITVQGSNNPPTVSITSPANGASFNEPAQITVTANAFDPGGSITKVEFFQGSTLLATDLSSPYSFTWSDIGDGFYSLTARATDNAGSSTTSPAVGITVESANPDPRALTGEWSPVFSWNQQVAIHMHVMPNGKVLSWQDDDDENYYLNGTRGPNKTVAQVWDVATGNFSNVPYSNTNLFCAGHSFLADGRLLIMGGHEETNGDGSVDTNIFDSDQGPNGQWINASPMAAGRWYPSACSLANGEVLTVAGLGHIGNPKVPEVWKADGTGWRTLSSAQIGLPYYPFMHLAPDGRVFISGPTRSSFYLDTRGTGVWSIGPDQNFVNYRVEGTAAMYDDGKVMVTGGGDPPTATTEVIDLRASIPSWRSVGSMAYSRRHFDATLLPDGKVLATGGTSSAGYNNSAGAVFAAEVWDPGTERWSTLASMLVRRQYHSTALLLPDGRVLTAGGGRPAAAGEDPLSEHQDAQIFSPPYLFKGARPMITLTPAAVRYDNQPFFVQTPDALNITAVNWIRLSSVTHGLNMNQRINRLSFSVTAGGLNVVAPTDNKLCPPGDYILFILNGNGVPSVGHIMRIGN